MWSDSSNLIVCVVLLSYVHAPDLSVLLCVWQMGAYGMDIMPTWNCIFFFFFINMLQNNIYQKEYRSLFNAGFKSNETRTRDNIVPEKLNVFSFLLIKTCYWISSCGLDLLRIWVAYWACGVSPLLQFEYRILEPNLPIFAVSVLFVFVTVGFRGVMVPPQTDQQFCCARLRL